MANLQLLVADAVSVLSLVSGPQWGIFLNGVPKIVPASVGLSFGVSAFQPIQSLVQTALSAAGAGALAGANIVPVIASTVQFDFSEDWTISNYPQEQGAFQSYNKVTLPFTVKVKLASGGSPSTRQAFLQTCLAIANSFELFDVVTPEVVFASCNVAHIEWSRAATNGVGLIVVDMWFAQIRVTATANFTNTQQPGNAGQQNTGNQQAQPLSAPQQSATAPGFN